MSVTTTAKSSSAPLLVATTAGPVRGGPGPPQLVLDLADNESGVRVEGCVAGGRRPARSGCFSPIASECGDSNNDINATREMWKFFAHIGGIGK